MRVLRGLSWLLTALVLGGCGFVHFGRLPKANDPALQQAYFDLSLEHKILKQELVLARKEEDALRSALDHAADTASGAAPNLTLQLEATTRELATLRANYAKLEAERTSAAAADSRVKKLEADLASEAASDVQLKEENTRLRHELETVRSQNVALAQQVKSSLGDVQQAHTTVAQLNSDLLTEKQARMRAEEVGSALRAQLDAVMARNGRAGAENPEPASPAAVPSSPASASTFAALSRAKAPPSDPAAVVELHTSQSHLRTGRSDAGASEPALNSTVAGSNGVTTTTVAPKMPAQMAPPKAAAGAQNIPASAEGTRGEPAAAAAVSSASSSTVAVPARTYTVQSGDTLEKIALREYGAVDQWSKIYAANAALLSTGQGLKPGTELVIPDQP